MSSAENGKPAGRLVWITEEQQHVLAMLVLGSPAVLWTGSSEYDPRMASLIAMVNAWDAAPADPAEAIRQAIFASYESAHLDPYERKIIEEYVAIVLQVLGVPSPQPTHTEGQ